MQRSEGPPLSLERYAELRADLDFGIPEAEALERAAIHHEAWLVSERHWLNLLSREEQQQQQQQPQSTLRLRFQAAFAKRKRELAESDDTLPLGVSAMSFAQPPSRPRDLPFRSDATTGPLTPRVLQGQPAPSSPGLPPPAPPPPISSPALGDAGGPGAPSVSLEGLPFRAPAHPPAESGPGWPHVAADPSGAPSARPSSRATRLSFEQFAMLSAELALWPSATANILVRYELDEPAHASEGLLWQQRFAADHEVYRRFAALVETYKEWLRGNRG